MNQPPVKLAYLLMLHKDVELFKRLFRVIHDPADYYLIRVDRKSKAPYHQAVADFVRGYANTRQMESIKMVWGGWSMVEVLLRAIEQLLRTAQDWQYLINLSGQDFPLQSKDRIRATLAQAPDRNYVHIIDPEKEWPFALARVRRYWLKIPGLPVRRPIGIPFIRRRFLSNVRPYAGSSWLIIGRRFCEWLTTSPEIERFKRFYKYTVCADEGFVQTVIMHSPFRDSVVNDNQRAIVWTGKSSPKTFTHADLGFLLSCGKFYARKFDRAVDEKVIDELEAHLRRQAGASPAPPAQA